MLIYFNTDTEYANVRENPLYQVTVLFCGLIKGIPPKMCILCVPVKINKRSFEPFCVGLCLSVSVCVPVFIVTDRVSYLSNILEGIHMSVTKGMNKGSKAR